jgi:hypothetical protein
MHIKPVEQADKESVINDKTAKNPDRNKNATEEVGIFRNICTKMEEDTHRYRSTKTL